MTYFEASNPPPNTQPRHNACPTQQISVVRFNPETRERSLDPVTWGLIPIWAKDRKIANQCFNARAETVANKPAFRDAYAKRRCLVPVDAFYEWKKIDAKTKQPYAIRPLADDGLLIFAGLWERWKNPETGELERSASIVTTTANEQMSPLHDRMPVILHRMNWRAWLGEDQSTPEQITALLAPWPEPLTIYPVAREVGNTRVDHARLIEPIAA
jgi:putative SOS response-associated peptidase YedK